MVGVLCFTCPHPDLFGGKMLPTFQAPPNLTSKKWLVGASIATLTSLLTLRLILTFYSFDNTLSSFRYLYTIFVMTAFVIPIILTTICFRKTNPIWSFTVPFALYAILCPVIDVFLVSLQGSPVTTIIPISAIFGGIGLGMLGFGSSCIRHDRVISIIFMLLGLSIMIISIPNVFYIVHWLLTGDQNSLYILL